jgi:hypothetical protein
MNLAAGDGSGSDRGWRGGCGRREVRSNVHHRVRLVFGLLVWPLKAVFAKVLGFRAVAAVPGQEAKQPAGAKGL